MINLYNEDCLEGKKIKATLTTVTRTDGAETTESDWQRANAGLDELSELFVAAKPLLDYSRENLTGNDVISICCGELKFYQNAGADKD